MRGECFQGGGSLSGGWLPEGMSARSRRPPPSCLASASPVRRGAGWLSWTIRPVHPNHGGGSVPEHGQPIPSGPSGPTRPSVAHQSRDLPGPSLSPEPTFLAFLPILCAVWADGLMEDDELRAVTGAIEGAEWMTPDGRGGRPRAWLDPANAACGPRLRRGGDADPQRHRRQRHPVAGRGRRGAARRSPPDGRSRTRCGHRALAGRGARDAGPHRAGTGTCRARGSQGAHRGCG